MPDMPLDVNEKNNESCFDVLNECVNILFSHDNYRDSVDELLAFAGESFSCDRVYIFENDFEAGLTSNTYEWCAPGVVPQKDILTDLDINSVEWWMNEFKKNNIIYIEELDAIKDEFPVAYAILKPQDIDRLVAGPIKFGGVVYGFVGVDNPDKEHMSSLKDIVRILGTMVSGHIRTLAKAASLSEDKSSVGLSTNFDRINRDYYNALKDNKSDFIQFLIESNYDPDSMFKSFSDDNDTSYFFLTDIQRNVMYISDNMRDDLGFDSNIVEDGFAKWINYISTEEAILKFQDDISEMLENKHKIHDLRYQIHTVKGEDVWIRCYGEMKWNYDETVPLFFSGRITHQEKLFVVDTLTNFPRAKTAVYRLSDIGNRKYYILGFCINHVAHINSYRGREFADRILEKIAHGLSKAVSAYRGVSVYRMESVKFMVTIDRDEAIISVDEIIKNIHDVVLEKYTEWGFSFDDICSFGLVEYPNEWFGINELIGNTVSLIRLARQRPNEKYVKYDIQIAEHVKDEADITIALSRCIHNRMMDFRPVVQPVVSSETGKIIAGEMLMRWRLNGKDISPVIFIPILESERLIQVAGRWIFDQAVSACMRVVTFIPDFYMSFNVSLYQLLDDGLIDYMRDTLDKYHLDGSHMVAELTESFMDEYPDKLDSFIKGCGELGIRIALDDFGTGYSSFRMLLQYSSDIIKLDRSLLTEMLESDRKQMFIESIVYSCHQFGKKVCIEGVEDEIQDELVKEAGCDIIQGFYYYKPMEVTELYKVVSNE